MDILFTKISIILFGSFWTFIWTSPIFEYWKEFHFKKSGWDPSDWHQILICLPFIILYILFLVENNFQAVGYLFWLTIIISIIFAILTKR